MIRASEIFNQTTEMKSSKHLKGDKFDKFPCFDK